MRASTVCFTVICSPFLCCYIGFTACFCPGKLRRQCEPEEKKRFERRQKNAPRPLGKRTRALTIPLPESASSTQQIADQSQSKLMSLPLELREMIWRYVLGDEIMHVVLKEKKLGHLRCKARSRAHCPRIVTSDMKTRESCWGWADTANIWSPPTGTDERSDGEIVPFLRTCRQIYSESINFLYSTNTFSFTDVECARHFLGKVVPHRFDLIQSLDVEWCLSWPIYDEIAQHLLLNHPALYPPHDETTWENLWYTIARMKGLKNLTVTLIYFDGFRDRLIERATLRPLRSITHVPNYEVYVNWAGPELHDLPFKLIRPVRREDDSSDDDW